MIMSGFLFIFCCWMPSTVHSHILMMGGGGGGIQLRFNLYSPKNPNFRICLPKKIPTFLACPKNPSVFLHQQTVLQIYHISSKLHLCYCCFELMKNTIPEKIVFFSQPKLDILASFTDQKQIPFGQNFRPKKSFGPPPPLPLAIKPLIWGPCTISYWKAQSNTQSKQ